MKHRIAALLLAVFALIGVGACFTGCAGTDDDQADVQTEFGQVSQATVSRQSAVGARIWGVIASSSGQIACNNLSTADCQFLSTATAASPEMRYQVLINSTDFTGSPLTQLQGFTDTWVSLMASSMNGSAVPFSFQRKTGNPTNIQVIKQIRTSALSAQFSRYIQVDFVCGATLLPSGQGVTVNPHMHGCSNAVVKFDRDSLLTYLSSQGYTATQTANAIQENLFHGLMIAFGIGQQSTTVNVISKATFSKTPIGNLFSSEELCRAKTLSNTSGIIDPGALYFSVSATTCS